MTPHLRLGVNIDHVATIRNARGGPHPDPVRAAELAVRAGADGITAHLREDRRHISDDDIDALAPRRRCAAQPGDGGDRGDAARSPCGIGRTPSAWCRSGAKSGPPKVGSTRWRVRRISDAVRPPAGRGRLRVRRCSSNRRRCRWRRRRRLGATPSNCTPAPGATRAVIAAPAETAAHRGRRPEAGDASGIECHAGHGLSYDNVGPVAAVPEIVELNIGHFLIGEAIFLGLEESIARMRSLMDAGPAMRLG